MIKKIDGQNEWSNSKFFSNAEGVRAPVSVPQERVVRAITPGPICRVEGPMSWAGNEEDLEEFICPITNDIFKDPVLASDGCNPPTRHA